MPAPIAASTIAAQAFRFMELSPISSYDDDSEQARAASEQYDMAMGHCLEVMDWSFASVLANLPEAVLSPTDAIDPDLPYLYAMPGDLVRLHEVGEIGTKWRRDRQGIRADTPAPLQVRYTAKVTNEAILPATFQTAVALQLALLLAPRWLGTQSKISEIEARAARMLKLAMRQDSQMASSARYDGLADQPDWVTEARL